MDLDSIMSKVVDFATVYGIKIIGAILIWIIGSWVIKKIIKDMKKVMSISGYDENLQKFHFKQDG